MLLPIESYSIKHEMKYIVNYLTLSFNRLLVLHFGDSIIWFIGCQKNKKRMKWTNEKLFLHQ
jgi:hypothetical protein